MCGDDCIDNDTPCNGVCQDPDNILCEGRCKSKIHYWDCNGTCKRIWEPCNGVCLHPRQKCGKKCVDLFKHKLWECNGKCQSHHYPCNEVCPNVENVSYLQESYLQCPRYKTCFLLSEECDPDFHDWKCQGGVRLSDKLCNRFPGYKKTFSCTEDKEQCKQSRQCIKSRDICNNVIDCFDRSDESLCSENINTELDFSIFNDCKKSGFNCGEECISYEDWCNSVALKEIITNYKLTDSDCPKLLQTLDNEILCQNLTFWSNRPCPVGSARVAGNYPAGQCIDYGTDLNGDIINKYWQPRGSLRKCNENQTSIHENLWCDGYTQCPDGSDEDPDDCGKCPRTYGFQKDSKHATFSCKHKYTGRPICAVPCDGKDDLCLDDVDEQCSSASVKSTLLFGTVLVIFSVIVGELYIAFVKKAYFKKREVFQLTMLKENFLWITLEKCSDGNASYKKTFSNFKKNHSTEKYAHNCITLSHTLQLMNAAKAQNIAKAFYNLECKYHQGNIESVHICIQSNFAANDNTKLLFKLMRQPQTKTQFLEKLILKAVLNILKTKFFATACFLLLVSSKLFTYYADVYKDINVIVEFSKLLPVGNLAWNSFGFQVFILLIVSVTLPFFVNLFTLHQAKEWSNLQSRFIHFAILVLSPVVPALTIYVSSKLNFVSESIKTFHQNKNKLKNENPSQPIRTLLKNDYWMRQTITLLSDLRSNENATEHFIQSLVLIMLIALKFTKTGTVSGFQELLAGKSDSFLLVLSAVWSVFSIIIGFVQRKIVHKNHSLSILGILIQFSYSTLAMISRISACVIFFAPAIGLFNLLWHWKMGDLAFESYAIYDVADNGTLIYTNDFFNKINKCEELTVFQLDVYYVVFLVIIFFHFIIVAAIKIKCSKRFKSRKEFLKKMLHILHQGNNSCTISAQNMLKMLFLN